jgi:uncharacterized protein YndB with AHSA1/START domain
MDTNSQSNNSSITVEATVNVPVQKTWKLWTTPEDIMQWNNASPDWHTPKAENDLRENGQFTYTMAARDGSFSFDFGGIYDEIKSNELIAYTIGDGRKVRVIFEAQGDNTRISETFDAENQNPVEMQKQGWQAILDNFKAYAEAQA